MQENLYNSNGLVFWNESEIKAREMFVSHMVFNIEQSLLRMNTAFKMVRMEAPILTPHDLINASYEDDDVYRLNGLTLRPETTMGSYEYAKHILSGYSTPKHKMPICVWQHGKSFRKEQDQPTKFMRLKEFYQLEFQILFATNTLNDYYPTIVQDALAALNQLLNDKCSTIPSDRLPSYSDETTDIMYDTTMEICSISRRKDFPNAKNIEVAIGTDRCVFNFINKVMKGQ